MQANRATSDPPKYRAATALAGLLRRSFVAVMLIAPLAAVSAEPAAGADGKARALLAQAEQTYETDVRASADFAQRALDLAKDSQDISFKRRIEAQLCGSLSAFAPERALPMAETGLNNARREHDRVSTARFLTCKAYAQESSGDMSTASVTYDAAFDAAQVSGDKKIIADVYAYRGENRQYQGRYDDALVDLNRAYALYLETRDGIGQRYTLNAIANLYSDPQVGEFDKAIEYYRQQMTLEESSGVKKPDSTTLFNIASVYEEKGDYDSALREFRRALDIDRAQPDPDGVAEEQRAIGRVLIAQGKPAEALPLIDSSMAYFTQSGNEEAIQRTRVTRSRALAALRRYDEAMRDIESARAHFEKSGNSRFLVQVHGLRAELFAARSDWRAAYLASKAQYVAQQQLDKGLMRERTSRLRVQFDTARKEEQNQALQVENERHAADLANAERVRGLQRLAILLGSALLLAMGLMVIQQSHKNQRMRALAMTDELTELPNRRHILRYLDEQMKPGEKSRTLSLIALDIDHFKRINDLHGHHAGDRVLVEVARIIGRNLRSIDRVGRVGGEEFLVVLPTTRLQDAAAVAERLRTAIAEARIEGSAPKGGVTASFGVSESSSEDGGMQPLLKRADDALYRAKEQGRDRVVLG